MNNKTIIGTLVGGIAFFLLGWLIYGIILMDYLAKNSNPAVWRDMQSMIWWALILSNFIWAYFMSMIFDWTNTNGFMPGMQKGLLLGLTTGLAVDLGMYANSTMYNSLTVVIVDIVAITVMTTIVGGILGMLRAGTKKADG